MDWIAGLKFILHDFHPIKCPKFGYFLIISCTSSSHCMVENVNECTLHKLHGWMCTMSSLCTLSELKAPSVAMQKRIKSTDKGLFTKKNHCDMGNTCVMYYTG